MTDYEPLNNDLDTDSRTVIYGVGWDMASDLSKDQWRELAIDLLRGQLGEDATARQLHAEIIQRMDALHAAGYVKRTLPRSRYPRSAELL